MTLDKIIIIIGIIITTIALITYTYSKPIEYSDFSDFLSL